MEFFKKVVMLSACLFVSLLANAQKKPFFLSECPVYQKYSPEYGGEFITSSLLKKQGVENVLESNMIRYRIVLAPRFSIRSSDDLVKLLKNGQKRLEVQAVIDGINAQSENPLQFLSMMGDKYPKAFYFRTPERPFICETYEEWSKEMRRLDGAFLKAQSEELCRENALMLAYYGNRFALENPSKMVILHYNGRSRDIYFDAEDFFAGHWIYSPGTIATADFDEKTEWINVENSDCFTMGFGLQQANKNDDVVIVPIDENGNKCWEKAEQTTVLAKKEGMVKLARGRYGTKARSFKKESTYLAPHVSEGPWGGNDNNLLWYYNFSTTCPKDKLGRTASDVLADELGRKFSNEGDLHSFHGIEFDIAPFDVNRLIQRRPLDVNNDGVGDGGVVDGVNVYGAGVHNFYIKLREKLGSKRLIMADGVVSDCQRATFVLNGAEAEGLSMPHMDYYFNELSRSVNALTYWSQHHYSPGFTYVTQKEQGAPQNYERFGRMRATIALATCLGVGINSFATYPQNGEYELSTPDEFLGGRLDVKGWLGSPIGEMQKLYLENNLLDGKSCQLVSDTIINGNRTYYLNDIYNPAINGNDLTIQFESKSMVSMPGQHPETARHIYVKAIGGDADKDSKWLTRTQMGIVGVNDFNSSIFYFRELGKGKYNFEITVEGEGEIEMKNITLHNQPFIFFREFENGCVIGNLSAVKVDFDLKKYFPHLKLRRLVGTNGQDTAYNNGKIEEGIVQIPKVNAIFLRKY